MKKAMKMNLNETLAALDREKLESAECAGNIGAIAEEIECLRVKKAYNETLLEHWQTRFNKCEKKINFYRQLIKQLKSQGEKENVHTD